MFFKNKKKADSKVRFQNRGFKNSLENQRNYKRNQKKLPQTDWGVFFKNIGLGTLLSKILTFSCLLILIYFTFIPNPFYIKSIKLEVRNQNLNNQSDIESSVNLYLKKFNPWPQKNLLFLSKNKLSNYLLENNKNILSVDLINKNFPNSLSITYTSREDRYVIKNSQNQYYLVSQDGKVTEEIYLNASGTLPSSLILIKLEQDLTLPLWQSPFLNNWFEFINGANSKIPNRVGTKVKQINFDNLKNPFFTVLTETGYDIKFDASSDLEKTLERLELLVKDLQPATVKNLQYIDMRFTDRAYICYKNSPCTYEPNSYNSSTTSNSIIN